MNILAKTRAVWSMVAAAALTLTCFVGLTAIQGSTAHAATNYAGLCGSNFVHKRTFTIPGGAIKVYTRGTGSRTDWCAFTVKQIKVGVRSSVIVHLDEAAGWYRNSFTESDSGNYLYYAGPVRKYDRSWVYAEGYVGGAGYIDGASYYLSN